MAGEFQVSGRNAAAPFTLKLHRGDGMTLMAMNWKDGKPPQDFVGFAIEYQEPDGQKFFVLKNRLGFRGAGGDVNPNVKSTRLSPIQKFHWVQTSQLCIELIFVQLIFRFTSYHRLELLGHTRKYHANNSTYIHTVPNCGQG